MEKQSKKIFISDFIGDLNAFRDNLTAIDFNINNKLTYHLLCIMHGLFSQYVKLGINNQNVSQFSEDLLYLLHKFGWIIFLVTKPFSHRNLHGHCHLEYHDNTGRSCYNNNVFIVFVKKNRYMQEQNGNAELFLKTLKQKVHMAPLRTTPLLSWDRNNPYFKQGWVHS